MGGHVRAGGASTAGKDGWHGASTMRAQCIDGGAQNLGSLSASPYSSRWYIAVSMWMREEEGAVIKERALAPVEATNQC
jgi:hypothetical protein